MDGGIFGLLGLIASHRGAVEYDWRTRFGTGLGVIGDGMSLAEAGRLAIILRADPSSMIAAALEGWSHPISREALIAMDHFDLDAMVNSGKRKPKPHAGRPWKQQGEAQKFGNAGGRSRAQVVEILNAHGHSLPV